MQKYHVQVLERNKDIVVDVPGSKSITNRALLMAALSKDTVVLNGVLFSDDSRVFLQALQDLGFQVQIEEAEKKVTVKGEGGLIPKRDAEIYVGSAGTAARFLTAMLGLSGGTYIINASEQMKKRPMKPLFDALVQLGVTFEYLEAEGFLPVQITGRKTQKDLQRVSLDISKTSQPLSALLMTSVMLGEGLEIEITSEKKQGSYIEITRKMMKTFGCDTRFDGEKYLISPDSSYHLKEYQVEPDVSAACYFYGIAAITGGSAVVRHVYKNTLQGDIRFVDVLEQMGCEVTDETEGVKVTAPKDGKLRGITVDMNNFSDQALTLAVVSIFADSPVTIQNIGHIRLQECDRLKAIVENMKRLNIACDEGEDWVKIYPGKPQSAEIETYEDHRVAMAFTLAGLASSGIVILNPMCCRKTFENYFEVINTLYE